MIDTHFRIVRLSGDGATLATGTNRQVFTRMDGGLLYHVPEIVAPSFLATTEHALGKELRAE